MKQFKRPFSRTAQAVSKKVSANKVKARLLKKDSSASKKPAAKRPRSGASQSRARRWDQLSSYFLHHQFTAAESLLRLLNSPLQSLLTWLVVAIALALPASLYVGLSNVQMLGQGWESAARVSVYLNSQAKDEAIKGLSANLSARSDIASVEYISPDQALLEFEKYSGFGQALESLDNNPLPAVLVLQPVAGLSPSALENLGKELIKNTLIDDVSLDMEWVRRLYQLMELAQRLVTALGMLLAVGVLLVIGNTIRLAIENRRDEILIVKLVGGTNAFVRRPFLYTGWWYGVGGGCIARVLLALALAGLSGPVEQLADLYESQFRLQGLNLSASVLLILGSGLLGVCGAWLAVSRHLGAIEPR